MKNWRLGAVLAVFFLLAAIMVGRLFFIQIMINIGMNIGLVPVTGISLPFMSYGGSFLVVSLALIGVIEGMVIRHQNPTI